MLELVLSPMDSNNVTTKPLVGATVVAVAGALASLGYAWHLRRELDLLRRHKNEQICDSAGSAGKRNVTENSSASNRERPANRSEPALIHPIGTIRSPFPQRAGTPRQGLLAPHARSLLILEEDMPFDVVDGLKEYSHVWVVFRFHLNPIGKGKDARARRALTQSNVGDVNGCESTSCPQCCRDCICSSQRPPFPTKIRPPRAGGTKTGCLATRSPHRPNEIGLSLACIEDIKTESYEKGGGKKRRRVVIRLLGLDLVDQTPVYDLKPYVPWDALGEELHVPTWVEKDDKLSEVRWSPDAKMAALNARQDGELMPLYLPLSKRARKRSQESNIDDEVIQAIAEIVSQDPRSIHEGRGNVDAATFDITFCALRVAFRVSNNHDEDDKSTFAEIVSVHKDQGDATAEPGSYQHSLHLRRRAEMKALERGVKLKWARPVQEGNPTGLYELEGGQKWSS